MEWSWKMCLKNLVYWVSTIQLHRFVEGCNCFSRNWCTYMTHPQLLEGLKEESQVQNNGKREGVGARSLTRNTKGGVEGACLSSGIRTRKGDKPYSLTRTCIKLTTKWLIHILEHLGARTSHGQLWTHKTHHGLDSGEANTFPHIVFYAPLDDTCIQMAFCPGTPKEESRNCPNSDSHHFAAS
jgi:hypothetical protein